MPAVVKFNHSEPYTQRHLSLQHARDKSSIFWPKHLHAHKCISGCGIDVKAVRSRDSDRRDFDRSRLWYTPVNSRRSHALYLELRQCPALPVRLRSRGSNPRHAPSRLVTTPRSWPFPFGSTVLGGFRTTRSQKNTWKIYWCWLGSNPGRLISSLTLYRLCHRAPLGFLYFLLMRMGMLCEPDALARNIDKTWSLLTLRSGAVFSSLHTNVFEAKLSNCVQIHQRCSSYIYCLQQIV